MKNWETFYFLVIELGTSVKSTMKHLATICPILYGAGEFKKKHCDIIRLT